MTDLLSHEEFAAMTDAAFCNWWQAWYGEKVTGQKSPDDYPEYCSPEELAAHAVTVREAFQQRWGAKAGDYMTFRLLSMYA
ncbi:hypothetical protein ELH77_19515 [Rhizobium ruizarguesonis]|uniref:hypothetical protein n=1 Tax=Rhizobium ruizarguesonis TaxID=2081791 RepID=UPI001031BACB|nr:hypothetical protein [Rhizobium ruizarguesonis]TAZ20793.1 hypothetical protein ELH77_19515 [Rhizobium ruizarguesonis]